VANFDVKITDNSGEFLDALPEQIEQALTAIGLTAESYAKRDCPVDTGRLRNSITNAVETGEQSVYIGSNVEYAAFVELGTSRMKARPYLRPAATEHTAEYKSLAEQALKGG
jgi:HK97 gp10 family phage protein